MATLMTDQGVTNNEKYASGEAIHTRSPCADSSPMWIPESMRKSAIQGQRGQLAESRSVDRGYRRRLPYHSGSLREYDSR